MATLNGTSKDDILFIPAGTSGNELLGLEGNDYLDATTGGGKNILRGGAGNDELFAYTNDQLFGDTGNDSLYSDGNGFNTLSGGDGNDTIFADHNDTVLGDAGDDLIFGGSGGNKLTGGPGKDIFYLTPNGVPTSPNEVLDFTPGEDKLLITAIPQIQTFEDFQRVQTGADTILRANIGGTVKDLAILKNFNANSLTRVDFNLPPAITNAPPVVNPDKAITLFEDAVPTALGITAPTDANGDPLTIIVNSVPDGTKGEIRLSDGSVVKTGVSLSIAQLTSLVFAPSLNANGTAGKFSYTVNDGQGGTATQSVAFNITPVNDAPVAQANKTLTLLQDAAPIALGITAPTDIEGDPLTLVVNSIPDAAKGQIRLANGTVVKAGDSLTLAQITTLVFAPTSKANGSAGNFSYTVSDGQGGIATQTVTFNITPVNNGGSAGDPHIYTFDGLHYDFQATGDFVLVRGIDSNLEVQVRQTPNDLWPGTTVNTGLATVVDGNRVEFYVDRSMPLVNDLQIQLKVGESLALGQGSISRTAINGYGVEGSLYTITYPNGDRLNNAVYGGLLMDPSLDLAQGSKVEGLLGDNNGIIEDDLALSNGTLLADPLVPSNLYGAFADSWQVKPQQSLFSSSALLPTDQTSTPSHDNLQALVQQYVFGGNGDDVLIGVGNQLASPTQSKVDIFMGNKGADTFVLGDKTKAFYVGEGQKDYALITDLWAEDRIQLHGSANDYVLGNTPTGLANGTGIFLAHNTNELVGIIQGVALDSTALNNTSIFNFV